MYRWTVLVFAVLLFVMAGCSGGGNPVSPGTDTDMTVTRDVSHSSHNTLWGYWDIHFDLENGNVEVVPNRDVMFTANVVTFLNPNPLGLGFTNIVCNPTADNMNVGIDVTLAHPLDLEAYDGYDVKGIFVGDGSASLDYSGVCRYAEKGSDQVVLNADGYTRWYNPVEFGGPGPEVLCYTHGKFASPGYNASATLNPYKLFADDLDSDESAYEFLKGGGTPTFSHGESWTRHYDIDFPMPKPNVTYGYAISASWAGETGDFHPAYAPEPGAISVGITPDVYYVSDSDKGGDLILDLDVPVFGGQPSTIYIESSVLSAPAMFSAVPTGGDSAFSAYHVEVTADNITGTDGAEYWVILECSEYDYTNGYGVINGADTDTLAAFFRYDLYVSPIAYNKAPVLVSGVDGEANPGESAVETYTVDVTDEDGDPLNYVWTVSDPDTGDPITGYDGVAGDGAGSLDVDFGAIGAAPRTMFDIDCMIDDGQADPIAADTLEVRVIPDADYYISNNPDFAAEPEVGTKSQPFHTISSAIASSYTLGDTFLIDFGTYNEHVYFNYGNGCTLYGFDWYTEDTEGNGRPILEYGSNYPLYLNYTNNVTVRGLKIQFASGASTNYLVRDYRSNGTTIMDCWFTGETSYQFPYAVYHYYGDNFTFVNNKISDFGTSNTSSYSFPYALYVYRGNGSHEISRNEITQIQPTDVSGYMYPYIVYAYYMPAGSEFNNNLIHHIDPTPGSGQSLYIYTLYMRYPYSTVEVAHNTIDQISIENSNYDYSSLYGLYIYDSGSTYGTNIHSNIVTSFHKYSSAQYTYGLYCYDGSDYCDVWDFPMGGYRYMNAPEGHNSINADPLYEEADTEPYDYHLQTGSPCIGTGYSGEDMGCYGGLAAGEVVGLISPE